MTTNITCSRCTEQKPPMTKAPFPGTDGERILESTCQKCWDEWREEEVRTINELRLNFMDPEAQKILRDRMLSYLGLEQAEVAALCDRGDSDRSDSDKGNSEKTTSSDPVEDAPKSSS